MPFLFALSLVAAALAPLPEAPAPVVLDVASQIAEVTVFQRGAQVTRVAGVSVPAGTSELTFTGLTTNLDPESLRLTAGGDFTILSVVHRVNYLEEQAPGAEQLRLESRREVLQDSLQLVRAELEVYEQEASLILENKNLGGNDGVEVGQLEAAAAFLRARLMEIKRRQLSLREDAERLQRAIRQLDGQIGELASQRAGTPTSEVTVTVQAARAQRADFRLGYVVAGAGWTPRYDLRVEQVGQPIELAYKAEVQQRTGEDWQNVRLTLSTGDPARPGTRPDLQPWYVGFYNPVPAPFRQSSASIAIPGPHVRNPAMVRGRVYDRQTGEPLPGANIYVDGTSAGAPTNIDGEYVIDLPPEARSGLLVAQFVGYQSIRTPLASDRIDFALAPGATDLQEITVTAVSPEVRRQADRVASSAAPPPVQIVDNPTSVSFQIELPYTIPSDGKPYTVQIDQLDVPAEYEYYAAPKLDETAYLTARVADWGTYNLLSGEANLFLEDTFVGQSLLDVRATTDTLVVSLGRDEGVVVRRTKLRDFTEHRLLGSRREETLGFEIEVRNTKRQPIAIVVEDQVPRSTDDRIDVDLEERGGADFDEETGILRWRLGVAAGETERVRFRYEVTHPRDRRVVLE